MEKVSKLFWNEAFWLPVGFTWKDLEQVPGIGKPSFTDLYFVPLFAVVLVVIRYAFERFIATPFCISIGITKNRRTSYEKNSICEHVFNTTSKKPSNQQIEGLAKQLDWPKEKVERWFRKRRRAMKLPLLIKATESCWRCIFYFWLFCFGGFTILPTNWFYDTTKWMEGYLINQDFNSCLRAYYLMELSFYTSLLFSQFIDVKRKDFYQMFVHHIVTILLIFTSYAINQHRIGVVIMFLHDASDFWLEAAKVFNYAKWQRFCDSLFVMFAAVFFFTRWIYFPFWVLHAMIIISWKVVGPFPSYYYFTALLSTLQILHLYWGSLILHMVYKLLSQGKVDRDTRSEDESTADESDPLNTTAATKKKKL